MHNVHVMLKVQLGQFVDCPVENSDLSFLYQQSDWLHILGLHPMKCAKHELIDNPRIVWAAQSSHCVYTAWNKADPPKENREKENDVSLTENSASLD